jgi:hypothetical protein
MTEEEAHNYLNAIADEMLSFGFQHCFILGMIDENAYPYHIDFNIDYFINFIFSFLNENEDIKEKLLKKFQIDCKECDYTDELIKFVKA